MTDVVAHGVGRPIADSERADVLDALRGVALLGILISHVPDFSGHSFMPPVQQAALDRFGVDGPGAVLQDFLIRGKFYSLFSLLFGIGFAIQLESADRRGVTFGRHFARRLAVLLLIGLAHSLIWYGDILADYAVIGFALIAMRNAGVKTLATILVLVFALRLAWPSLVAALLSSVARNPGADPGSDFSSLTNAFGSADPAVIFVANLELVRLKALQLVYDGRAISILSMFVLGALIGKLNLHRTLPAHRRLFRTVFLICAPLGVIGNSLLTPLHATTPDFPPTGKWVLENSLYAIAVPAMTLAYASGMAWLWSCGRGRFLRLFAPAGRMALTTYLCQTLVGIGLCYGVGLGLRGHIGLVDGIVLAVAVFAVQAAFAAVWLRRFHFGPVEWLWRTLTYGAPIALRRRTRELQEHK